jgi:hypothetical protein
VLRKALALLLLPVALPCAGQDLRLAEPSVLYFVSVPLGGARSERAPTFGFALHGRRHALQVDSRILRLAGGGVEAKWLIVGGVAAGAAVLATRKDATVEAQRARQEQAQATACPARPAC